MGTINTSNFGQKNTVKVYCTNSDKTVVADLVRMDKDKITVILPGFQKLILNKVAAKPHFYTANMFGMEFTCNVQDK
jgi:hypothetical protein